MTIPLATAEEVAHRLVARLDCFCERIVAAGSVRRRKPEVKDLELVAIPRMQGAGLFGDRGINLLNKELDRMVLLGEVRWDFHDSEGRKHHVWGEKFRKFWVEIGGRKLTVDFFQADERNFGSILLIRTGPADFSKRWVTELLRRGMRHERGRVWRADEVIDTPDERACFELVAWEYVQPEDRA